MNIKRGGQWYRQVIADWPKVETHCVLCDLRKTRLCFGLKRCQNNVHYIKEADPCPTH